MNPVLQILKHTVFGAHNIGKILLGQGRLTDGKMRRAVSKGLVEYPATVDEDSCIGCGVCARVCPMKCITMEPLPEKVELRQGQYKEKIPRINHGQCMYCFQCHDNCPVYTVHHRAAAIHPRNVKKIGLTAKELFEKMDERIRKAQTNKEGGD